MKYIKYFEGYKQQVNFDLIIERLKCLSILGFKCEFNGLDEENKPEFEFNVDFVSIPYSILSVSTIVFKSYKVTLAMPKFNNETFTFIKTLNYPISSRLKPYTNEGIYAYLISNLIRKFNNFNRGLRVSLDIGSDGDYSYADTLENLDIKKVILDYLESNKEFNNEIIIPQSSIDMVKKEIDNCKSGKKQHELVSGIQKQNPLLYNKIKNEDYNKGADMHEMGFGDD
jgi:hypothetical protein